MINADNILLQLSQHLKIFSSPTLHLFVLRVPLDDNFTNLNGQKKRKRRQMQCIIFSLSVKITSPKKF